MSCRARCTTQSREAVLLTNQVIHANPETPDIPFNIAQSGKPSFHKSESYNPKHKHMVVESHNLEEGLASIIKSRDRPKWLAGKTESREKTKVVDKPDRKQRKDQRSRIANLAGPLL